VDDIILQSTQPSTASQSYTHFNFYTMSLWAAPPTPASKLGRYRTLSTLAGVRVSPIQLGAMSIGDKWDSVGMGSMNKENSFKLLDAYFDLGVRQICLLCLPRLRQDPPRIGKLH
jgi:hypothetical protein